MALDEAKTGRDKMLRDIEAGPAWAGASSPHAPSSLTHYLPQDPSEAPSPSPATAATPPAKPSTWRSFPFPPQAPCHTHRRPPPASMTLSSFQLHAPGRAHNFMPCIRNFLMHSAALRIESSKSAECMHSASVSPPGEHIPGLLRLCCGSQRD